jgi:hypothetical protein
MCVFFFFKPSKGKIGRTMSNWSCFTHVTSLPYKKIESPIKVFKSYQIDNLEVSCQFMVLYHKLLLVQGAK